ncbi:MAG: GNAT family N-acetyltransferase [Alphaproteobacteria bacterium]|nr:GNAT family N-acetyltransferase [Alphaproteobacteria bacterium]MBU0797494.1 GNAT family N-acetyltransferase [Alphaproteobacteria bacterium]MBU0889077.1 GNAT family N-acetyltransferase [Alphaproteobacteria bacterium]MBU1813261.1 GNAT family N-acetyltransferase [Alphaproteobacteria bacterium]MBU2090154.1 GNAT family N-acetyltransferase [Alphaproteobacteria bacterium]
MADTDTLAIMPLAEDAIPDGLALVAEAGWNQTAEDWRVMIWNGRAIGCQDSTGRFIASGLALPYGDRIGWISMVLVAGAWRRKGIATRLVEDCARWLEDRSITPVLDATPAGAAVYRRMGFETIARMTRWHRPADAVRVAAPALVRPATPDDLPHIAMTDAKVFGGFRRFLLDDLLMRPGAVAQVAVAPSCGFALSRKGRVATQIGPLMAQDEATGIALLDGMLAAIDGPVLVDAFDQHEGFVARLEACGFTAQRPFERMVRGAKTTIGMAERCFAAAGPELG